MQFGIVLKRDPKRRAPSCGCVGVTNRPFLIAAAVFMRKMRKLTVADHILDGIDKRRLARAILPIDDYRSAVGFQRDRIGRTSEPRETDGFDPHFAGSPAGDLVATVSRDCASSVSSRGRSERWRMVPFNCSSIIEATASATGEPFSASATRAVIQASSMGLPVVHGTYTY